MLASQIIRDAYNFLKEKITFFYRFFKDLPDFINKKRSEIKNYITDLNYKLKNLKEVNLKLGKYHITSGNINDAILRFKLINKFLSPNNLEANNWLGWCYLLKGDTEKAIKCLEKSSSIDKVKLGEFLKKHAATDYINCREVPVDIWRQYRNLIAGYYADRFFNSKGIHLPFSMTQQIMEVITELPDQYTVLELGSNIGLLGDEVRRRFPDSFMLIGVECSNSMMELVEKYYPKSNIYDQIIEESPKSFIEKAVNSNEDKFDVIISYCGLTFVKDLQPYFNSIYSILETGGYFAFCLPVLNTTADRQNAVFSYKYGEFVFSEADVEKALSTCKFQLLKYKKFSLDKNNEYSVYVLLKE